MQKLYLNPGVAGVLSFLIPGLGQIYCQRVARGLLLFTAFIVGMVLFVIPGLVVWIFSIVDAVRVAKEHNGGSLDNKYMLKKVTFFNMYLLSRDPPLCSFATRTASTIEKIQTTKPGITNNTIPTINAVKRRKPLATL